MFGRFFCISMNVVMVLAFYHEGRRKQSRFLDVRNRMLYNNDITDDFKMKLTESAPRIFSNKTDHNINSFEMLFQRLYSLQLQRYRFKHAKSDEAEINPAKIVYSNYLRNLGSENLSLKTNNFKTSLNPFSYQDESSVVRFRLKSKPDEASARIDGSISQKEPAVTSFLDAQILNDQKSDHQKLRSRGERDVSSPSMKSKSCHSQHLQTCGSTLIKRFEDEPSAALKCKIREDFLDCMVQQRERECTPSLNNFSPDGTNSIRSQVKNLLWSAHGCLLF